MNTVWAYLIVSSDKQAESLEEGQEVWAKETAAANGWEITRTFGGVGSGYERVRDELIHMVGELRRLPAHLRPHRILMNRLDRIGRGKIGPSMMALDEIEAMGIILHTREHGDESADTPEGEMVRAVRLSLARFNNAVRVDMVKAGIKRRRAAGKHLGTVPYGVILVDGRAQAYEPEAVIVRQIYELAANGWGLGRIARWAAENAPDKRKADGTTQRINWSPSIVQSLLHGQTVRQVVVDDASIAAMERARRISFRVAKPARHPWPLRGAVRCTCGKLLSGHLGGNAPYLYRYYFCRWHSLTKGQIHPAHRAEELEARFVAILNELRANRDQYFAPEPARTDELVVRERAARKDLARFDERVQHAWDAAQSVTPAQLRERLDKLEGDRAKAQAIVDRVRDEMHSANAVVEATQALSEVFDKLVERYPTASVTLQQQTAIAVAALSTVRGLWAHPDRPGALFTGVDGAKLFSGEANMYTAPYEHSLSRIDLESLKSLILLFPGKPSNFAPART